MMLEALLLADGRFPAGGHVHSAGVEAAVADGRVHDEDSLAAYMRGRLLTAGLTDAALAVATTTRSRARGRARASVPSCCSRSTPKPARASRRRRCAGIAPARAPTRARGCAVLAVGRCCRMPPGWCPTARTNRAPWGWSAVRRGWPTDEVARVAVHHAIATPGQAGVRLLGLDPFAVVALAGRARRRRRGGGAGGADVRRRAPRRPARAHGAGGRDRGDGARAVGRPDVHDVRRPLMGRRARRTSDHEHDDHEHEHEAHDDHRAACRGSAAPCGSASAGRSGAGRPRWSRRCAAH